MTKRLYMASFILSVIAAAFHACDDDPDVVASKPDGGVTDAAADVRKDIDSGPGPVDAGKDADASDFKYVVKVIAQFDPAKRELPDGIAVIPGAAGEFGTPVVGLNNTGKAAKVYPDGGYELVTQFAPWSPIARLTFVHYDPTQGLTGAAVTFGAVDAAVPPVGIYRMPMDGGAPTLMSTAQDPSIQFPNTFGYLNGNYYIADSNGWIAKLDPVTGIATKWATGTAFEGNKAACPAGPLTTPRNLGADAVAIQGNDIFVTNFDLGSLVKVTVNADGTPGTPVVLYKGLDNGGTDCTLQSIDGVAVDTDGSFFVGNSLKNTLYHMNKDGSGLKLLLQGKPPFDQVSNFFLEKAGKKKRLLLSNFANGAFIADAGPTPQLLQIDLPEDP